MISYASNEERKKSAHYKKKKKTLKIHFNLIAEHETCS